MANVLLIVADTGNLVFDEQWYQTELQSRGHTVTLRNASATEDATGQDLIVICENISSGALGSKYSTLAIPALVNEAFVWDDWNLATTPIYSGILTGANNEDAVNVQNESHPLAAGLLASNNPHQFTTEPDFFTGYTETLAPGGVSVFSWAAGDSGDVIVFALPSGGGLVGGGSAPALRIGIPWSGSAYTNLTAAGEAIVNAALDMLEDELAPDIGNIVAEAGTLTLSSPAASTWMALQSGPGALTIQGREALSTTRLAANSSSLVLEGRDASLTPTDQDFLVVDPGTLLLEQGDALFDNTLLGDNGVLSLGGGSLAFHQSVVLEFGLLDLEGADLTFDADVILFSAPALLSLLGGQASLRHFLNAEGGDLIIIGTDAELESTHLDHVIAAAGTLNLLGADISFLIKGLTWEDDDATWGGSQAIFGVLRPIFVHGNRFFQADSSEGFDLEPIEVDLERIGLTVVGRDREGKPRSDPSVLKLLTEIWPVIRGVPGTQIDIYAGAQDSPHDGVLWQGPFPFIVGQDISVQPLVEGAYLAVRFYSFGQKRWFLLDYDLDIQVLGRLSH